MKRNPVRLLCLLGLLAVFCTPTTVRAENYVLVAYVDGGEVPEYEIAIVMGTPDSDPILMGTPDGTPIVMGLRRTATRRF